MVIEIGVARAAVLAKYMARVKRAEAQLEVEREKLAIASEGALAGYELTGPITVIDELKGTITTQDHTCESAPSSAPSSSRAARRKSSRSSSAGAGSNTGTATRSRSTRSATSFSTRSRHVKRATKRAARSVPR